MNTTGLNFRSHACHRCGGDAYLDRSDEPEWRCLQCGRIVPPMVEVQPLNARPVAPAAGATRRAA